MGKVPTENGALKAEKSVLCHMLVDDTLHQAGKWVNWAH